MVSARVKDFLINLLVASVLAVILFGGFFIFRSNKKIEEFGYTLLGKVFPGPHVKVKGTEVKGFVDGKKIDHLGGVVTEIIPETESNFRIKIEQEGETEEILISLSTQIYFGDTKITQNPGDLMKGEAEGIKIGDTLILDNIKKAQLGEVESGFVIVVR